MANYRWANENHLNDAINASLAARKEWDRTCPNFRADIFDKAADLLAGEFRAEICARTMVGQAKNAWQAEIDAACELIDFFRFNAYYARNLHAQQPISPDAGITNSCVYRGLEGFVAAIAPFNFTAISGNLAGTPAMMGNTVLWKPSDTCVSSSWLIFKILTERCGLPKDIIQFVPADGPVFGQTVTSNKDLAAINFTGSVPTFEWLVRTVGQNISDYKGFPIMVGECGGKNYHFMHPSGDANSVITGTIRSAFEYSGQKCSACSRAYIPASRWEEVKNGLLSIHQEIMDNNMFGPADQPKTFVSAVIDDKSFARNKHWIDTAKSDPELTILAGGNYDDSVGYFIEPTIILTSNPKNPIMETEIFGPVVSIFVYQDEDWKSVLEYMPESQYALTGGIFVKDEEAKAYTIDALRDSAGNFYVNDKSTGSVVGQQWFGGARKSGTNDKAGGPEYVGKWVSRQTVKTTEFDLSGWKYPSNEE